jgi:hypothetical protein
MLMLAILATLVPVGTAQPGLPEIIVDVEDVGNVVTDPVDFNHVSAKATVTIENFLLGATVKVNATTDNFWLVTVSPEEITVDQGSSSRVENINVDIRVPPGASADLPVQLTVYANATSSVGGLVYEDEDVTDINVRQYYGVRVSTNGTSALEQGKNVTHRMRMTNTGNGKDNFTVTLNNDATLKARGLELEFEGEVFDVGADRTHSVVVRVRTTDNAEVGTVEAVFSIISDGDATKSVTYRLTITVRVGTGENGGNNGNGNGNDDDGGIPGFVTIAALVALMVIASILVITRTRNG